MIIPKVYYRPDTLFEGIQYFLRKANEAEIGYEVVTFLSYDPCPALVILRDEHGHRLRCERQYLFLVTDGNPHLP